MNTVSNEMNKKTTIYEITAEPEGERRIRLSESPEEAFKDPDSIVSTPKNNQRRSSIARSIKGLSKNKVLPQKLPPIKRIKTKKMNKIKNSATVKTVSKSEGFDISWINLSYIVDKSSLSCIPFKTSKSSVRVILKCLSGSFRSSELTAVMGPSGAGKSTLLSCVCGKQTKGISGEIIVTGCEGIKVAIIKQNDYLTDKFTLKEALIFASKTKNGTKKVDHEEVINNVVNDLALESCLNTLLGKCSGGQRRKVSIALELVSNPNILILDEPTSGLDSSACFQIVENLRELTQHKKSPMAIVATIHQPSAKVFSLFHTIYVISHNGQCIYDGSPDDLVEHLSKVSLSVPEYHNPADYIAEIASGEHGDQHVTKLATLRTESANKLKPIEMKPNSKKLSKLSQKHRQPVVLHTLVLIKRSFMLIVREPYLSTLRLTMALMIGLFIGLMFNHDIGRVSGCPPRTETLYTTNPIDFYKDFEFEKKRVEENVGSLFFNNVFLMYAGILPMILVFPNEVNVIIKHYNNGWYSSVTYYISKVISDVPLIALVTLIYLTLWYLLSAQIEELWRFSLVILIGFLVMIIGQSQGMICSALFSTNPVTASYVGIISTTPFFLLSGFLVRTKRIPTYLRPLIFLSYTKYSFESMVISLYGYDRCWYPETNGTLTQPPWLRFLKMLTTTMINNNKNEDDFGYEDSEETEDKAMNDIMVLFSGTKPNIEDKYKSMVMSEFEFTDDMLPLNLCVLTLNAIIYQFVGYFVLLWKLRKSH